MKLNQMKQTDLRSLLLEFHVESAGGPKSAILEAYCRRYPEYAHELTDYALELLLDDATSVVVTSDVAASVSSPFVSRAISRLYERIRDRETETDSETRSSTIQTLNPFEGLSVARVRVIRDALGIDTPLFGKFRNRLIDPDTAPPGFLQRFAVHLERSFDEFVSYLRLPQTVHAAADFKAEGKPSVAGRKQSFEDAVRGSSLDDKQKQALLKG